jgi:hypothetical protein
MSIPPDWRQELDRILDADYYEAEQVLKAEISRT